MLSIKSMPVGTGPTAEKALSRDTPAELSAMPSLPNYLSGRPAIGSSIYAGQIKIPPLPTGEDLPQEHSAPPIKLMQLRPRRVENQEGVLSTNGLGFQLLSAVAFLVICHQVGFRFSDVVAGEKEPQPVLKPISMRESGATDLQAVDAAPMPREDFHQEEN